MLGSRSATDSGAQNRMIIVGLSPTAHESAIGILIDGRIVAAASEERFTRVKNQGGFPTRALEFCLKRAGIQAKDVDHVAYAALPFHKERLRDVVNYSQNVRYVTTAGGSAKSRIFHLANYARALAKNDNWLTGKNEALIRGSLREFGLDQKLVFVD